MKIKTIEEIHKILKQKVIESERIKHDFNNKMVEKYKGVYWKVKATTEEQNEYERLLSDWNKYSKILIDFEENEF